ncbi:unnamed protein product, partial [Amoebophrya sp. A120]
DTNPTLRVHLLVYKRTLPFRGVFDGERSMPVLVYSVTPSRSASAQKYHPADAMHFVWTGYSGGASLSSEFRCFQKRDDVFPDGLSRGKMCLEVALLGEEEWTGFEPRWRIHTYHVGDLRGWDDWKKLVENMDRKKGGYATNPNFFARDLITNNTTSTGGRIKPGDDLAEAVFGGPNRTLTRARCEADFYARQTPDEPDTTKKQHDAWRQIRRALQGRLTRFPR